MEMIREQSFKEAQNMRLGREWLGLPTPREMYEYHKEKFLEGIGKKWKRYMFLKGPQNYLPEFPI